MAINFKLSVEDSDAIWRISRRAMKLYKKHDEDVEQQEIQMDLTACHNHGCPLDLERMEGADDFNLMHDISGINRHLNREDGSLMNHFLPRFALREVAA